MILMLNNRDSFVFNLARYMTELGAEMEIADSDRISLNDIRRLVPEAIIISPGPCTPVEAGVSLEAVHTFAGQVPILGVCLGHQVIAAAYGWTITRASVPAHGRAARIAHTGERLFRALPSDIEVGLYHSLVATPPEGEAGLIIDAVSPSGEVMALSHPRHPLYGVQFHPESILTPNGHEMLQNFLGLAKNWSLPCSA